MKQDRQRRRTSSKDEPLERLHPRSDMNTRALGGDKESNEPLRKRLKGNSAQPQTSVGRKPGR